MLFTSHRTRTLGVLALSTAALVALAGCTAGDTTDTETSSTATESETVEADAALRALLPKEILDAGVLTVSTPLNNAPMIFVDEDGEPTGAAFDIGQAIGEVLGVEVEFSELAFAGVIPGLQASSFDLSMGVIGDTPERQELLDFVDLLTNDSALLVQSGNPDDVTDLASLCGKTVGTLAGALQIALVTEASDACEAEGEDPITVNEYSSGPDGQAQLASGRITAFMGPYVSVAYTAKTAGDGETFEVAEGLYPSNPWAIAMTKDRGTLAEAVQGALAELVENGVYVQILEQYDIEGAALSADQVLINGAGTAAFQ